MGLPLAGTHRPGRMRCFHGNPRRIRNFPMGRQSRRPLQRDSNTQYPVGADDSVRPQKARFFTKTFGEFGIAQRADVGIGPYSVSANSYQFPSKTKKRIT